MRRIAKGRTVIIIAHRLAAVRGCDRIVGMSGRTHRRGRHACRASAPPRGPLCLPLESFRASQRRSRRERDSSAPRRSRARAIEPFGFPRSLAFFKAARARLVRFKTPGMNSRATGSSLLPRLRSWRRRPLRCTSLSSGSSAPSSSSALAWAYFGRVDIVAAAQGKFQPTGQVKVVEPVETGKVEAIQRRQWRARAARAMCWSSLIAPRPWRTPTGAGAELASVQAEILRRTTALLGARSHASSIPLTGDRLAVKGRSAGIARAREPASSPRILGNWRRMSPRSMQSAPKKRPSATNCARDHRDAEKPCRDPSGARRRCASKLVDS